MANYICFTDEKDGYDTILELRTHNGVYLSIAPESSAGYDIQLSDEDAKELVNRLKEYLSTVK